MGARSGPWSVLVVAADDATRTALEGLLTDDGYVVVTAATGSEVRAILRGVAPSLALLAFRWSDPECVQVLDAITAAGRSIPILTMDTGPRPDELAERYPTMAYLVVPFEPDALVSVVAEAVGRLAQG